MLDRRLHEKTISAYASQITGFFLFIFPLHNNELKTNLKHTSYFGGEGIELGKLKKQLFAKFAKVSAWKKKFRSIDDANVFVFDTGRLFRFHNFCDQLSTLFSLI